MYASHAVLHGQKEGNGWRSGSSASYSFGIAQLIKLKKSRGVPGSPLELPGDSFLTVPLVFVTSRALDVFTVELSIVANSVLNQSLKLSEQLGL